MMRVTWNSWRLLLVALLLAISTMPTARAADVRVLFLGDAGHHQPRPRFEQLQPVMAARGIDLVYTDKLSDLNAEKLAKFDAVLLYANIDRIEPAPAQALLDYVAGGGGFVPLHCASYCFRNSAELVQLMGAQFERHGTGVFRTEIAGADHPLMKGFGGFESWDETYVHRLHNEKERTVLEYRVDAEGREPWTWVRTHGKGRVFYTAWGHDERTWGNAGFQNLVERGIRWAAGKDPAVVPDFMSQSPFTIPRMTPLRQDVAPFEYVDVGAKIPNYVPAKKWGEQAEPHTRMQKPLPAAESIKHLVVPEGFHVELFAAEPDLGGKPIAMNWDERGRLLVAETYDYPNELQPSGQGRDRLRICEDTDGDGRADKFTVFAEKLSIPTAVLACRGGVLVQDGAETVFLQDTDGDDRADQRHVLITGWGIKDTHGGVSNFRYGLDNWIWAMQGYNRSQPVVNGKPLQEFRNGFFRFRLDNSDPPKVTELEFLRSTNNNTWGLGLSEEGLAFGSTANHNPSVYLPIPNRYYERVRGWTPSLELGTIADTHLFKPITDKVRQVDHFGGYTAGAGHALYTARQYPQQYWNRTAFVNGPTGHLVGTFVLTPDGSDFRSTSPFNLLASDDEWTAPIMAEVGPDGNVWVIDWYNYIVQHNPTPRGFETGKGAAYETDLRDKKHGRIYRVVYDLAKPAALVSLADASPEQLVAALAHPTMLWRLQAQRLLVEQQRVEMLPALVTLAADTSVDPVGLNVGAIHALATMAGLNLLDGSHPDVTAAAIAALKHRSAGVRRNAAALLPPNAVSTDALLAAGVLQDSDAQVRLAAMLALADLPPTAAAGEQLVAAMLRPENTTDRWIPEAAICAAAKQVDAFLLAAIRVPQPPEKFTQTVTIVAEHVAREARVEALPPLLAALPGTPPSMTSAVLRGLAQGWPADKTVPDSVALASAVERLLPGMKLGERALLLRFAQRLGIAGVDVELNRVRSELLAQLDDASRDDDERLSAARDLVDLSPADDRTVETVLDRVTPRTPPSLAVGLLRALDRSESSQLGSLAVARFGRLSPANRTVAISVLLGRPQSTKALLDGLSVQQVQLGELSLDQKQMLADHPDKSIRERARAVLAASGTLPSADRKQVLEELLPVARETGDAAAGKLVFKKHCSKCHVHSGEGERIGPELTGMAVHPKEELLGHILDPSRSVEGNFQTYTVVTVDGRLVNGLLASESKTSLEILDAEAKRTTVLREDVEELVRSTKSLMPDGLEKQATREELRDLLEFLTERGRFLPLDLSKAATISSALGMFNDKRSGVERLVLDDWSPRTVRGVPFQLIDPRGGQTPNVILLEGSRGAVCRTMPRGAELPCHGPVGAIHLLSGVSGWGYPATDERTVSLIVRLHYADGTSEDHPLVNGEHFADYIRHVDVPGSELAFLLRQQQIRYLVIRPRRDESLDRLEFVKGPDPTAPVIMAVTLESPSGGQAD
ncbi:MAG: PVC-type heme-binding CxxCH protein [Pirellulales bacterium]